LPVVLGALCFLLFPLPQIGLPGRCPLGCARRRAFLPGYGCGVTHGLQESLVVLHAKGESVLVETALRPHVPGFEIAMVGRNGILDLRDVRQGGFAGGSSDGRMEEKGRLKGSFSCKSASTEGKNGNTDFTPAAYRVTSQLPFLKSYTALPEGASREFSSPSLQLIGWTRGFV
jgi:hypothetical protein